jgi:uncharacterized protein (TIGR02001 family)
MKNNILPIALSLALAAATPAVQAELSANVTLTTDYVWRGVSQTDEGPAIQGGFDYSHKSGLYVGVWGSNVDFNEVDDEGQAVANPARIEIDVYAGIRRRLTESVEWELSVLRYMYPHTTLDLDYNEFAARLKLGPTSLGFQYSNDVFASGKNGFYYTVGAQHELPGSFNLAASIGYSSFDEEVFGQGNPRGYVDWRVGISRELAGFNFDLSYYDTDENGERLNGKLAKARAVFTISKSFE